MAIRPVDLQSAIVQQVQTAALTRQQEEAPRMAQVASQIAFEHDLTKREESIQAADHGEAGSKVQPRKEREPGDGRRKKRERLPGEPFDADEEAEFPVLTASEHLIDFSA